MVLIYHTIYRMSSIFFDKLKIYYLTMSKESKRMNIIEVQTNLQKVTKTRISLAEIGRVLGITRQAISERAKNCRDLEAKELSIISQHYEIDLLSTSEALMEEKRNALDKLLSDTVEKVQIDYYPDVLVSCGNGIYSLGETKEQLTIPKKLIRHYSEANKYAIVTAYSDSMIPEIKPKDMLVLRLIDTENIIDNHIYVFCHEGRFYCKYLSYNLGQIIVRSANADYPPRYIEKTELENFQLIGEVCGIFRNVV